MPAPHKILCNGKLIRGTGWAEGVEFKSSIVVGSLPDRKASRSGSPATGGTWGVPVPATDREPGEVKPENKERAVRRARTVCRRKAYELYGRNKGEMYKLELTYRENMDDRERLMKDWRSFVLRVRKAGYDFQYIAVMERQKRGAWHFHVLTNVHMDWKKWEEIWGHGFIWIEKPKSLKKAVSYMVKYIQKTFDIQELNGKHRYLCSKGIGFETVYVAEGESEQRAFGTWLAAKSEDESLVMTGYLELSEQGIRWWEAWEKGLLDEKSGEPPPVNF